MWSLWAAVSSVLLAIQPIAASYVPKSPNGVEPTNAAIASNYLLGMSPRITDSPIPDPGDLAARADAYDRKTDTCGFYSNGYPLRCYTSTATCGYGPKFAACCESGTTCSTMFTGCYGFSDALKGSCSPGKLKTEPQMACCFDRTAPNCVLHTLLISSTSLGVWGCATTLTGETVFATNPFLKTTTDSTSSLSRTRLSSTTTSTSESTATSASAGSSTSNETTENNTGDNKSNTGAIVGGVVGGVGGLAILGAAVFFFMRSRKNSSFETSPGAIAAAQPMLQYHQQGPHPGQGSPFGYHPQGRFPVYDPYMAYQHHQGSPQPYPPSSQPSSQSPYDPRQSGHGSWGQPSPGLTSSPGPQASNAPGASSPAISGPISVGQQHGQIAELAQSNAVGTTVNRAELG
ncbi:hypothetical protein IF1G_01492 [Cordyceps javanica]|uniref:Wnt and FGF inhibitory regulator domain-containing protein n=1 Tax=Cordyceps javanica TaxID=43265 RepID=A0A545WAN7_9HYPO|nr:hypothetical protein IF1G_01492 [Cordyceps javanica]TQW11050.1 mid2 like cell wall stress sensor domain-containing protein [Cordyceps javanica]